MICPHVLCQGKSEARPNVPARGPQSAADAQAPTTAASTTAATAAANKGAQNEPKIRPGKSKPLGSGQKKI